MKRILTVLIGVYLFLIPWDGFFLLELNFPISPSFLFLGLSILIHFVLICSDSSPKLKAPKFLIPLFILLIYATFTLIWTTDINGGLIEVITIWSYFLTIIHIYTLINSRNIYVIYLLWYYIFGALTIGIYSIIRNGLLIDRFTIIGGLNPSWYAAFLTWAIVACYVVYNKSKTPGKITAVLSAGTMIFILILTQGRTSILALSVSLIITIIIYFITEITVNRTINFKRLNSMHIKKLLITTSIISIIGWGISVVIVETGASERLNRIAEISELVSGDRDDATAGRTIIWERYTDILASTAAVGGGVNSSSDIYTKYYGIENSPHNIYISILVEYGVLGLLLWGTLILLIMKSAFQNNEMKFPLIWFAFIFTFLGIGNDILYYKYWWIGLLIFVIIKNLDKIPIKK
ncbi:O-antigen ligase family protein [Alkalicoccus halolimnae]|uniref:O-antigen ligase family protein n=1 Tax=Alkalicoccus halolimnae TaxID=1667239 RepID=A0A5C7F8M8_9BACI|nr:O-antigen ligase family protein [Alkalicoccus halolimnae]TXF87012.1 hypothetical protein FTX54_03550 [Alkalicoccus halolimnae]